MDMYYGATNRKKKEEDIVMEPSAIEEEKEKEEEVEPVIPEVQVQETQKPKFLDKFLKRLNDVMDKIE